MKFHHNPNLLDELKRDKALVLGLMETGRDVADTARSLGQQVSSSYETKVTVTGEGVRVEADTRALNAASWIEFGTGPPTPTPAHAPLRRAAEAEGLELRK